MPCEYFFLGFHTRGSDEYINAWAADVDRMAAQGWDVIGSVRDQGKPFHWTVCLYRDTQTGPTSSGAASSPSTVGQSTETRRYHRVMGISARNQLRGAIHDIVLGEVMAHITVQVGDNMIESMISRRSAEELKLKKGDKVVAIIKSTEVMIQKD
jgi:molybdopterin-binding protein